MDKKHPQVFISHTAKDQVWAARFAEALQAHGIATWYAATSIRLGDRWRDRVQDALRESRILCLIVSTANIQSPWTFFELGAAVADQKVIIPVLTEEVEVSSLPPILAQFQALKASSPKEAADRVAEIAIEAADQT